MSKHLELNSRDKPESQLERWNDDHQSTISRVVIEESLKVRISYSKESV